MNARQTRFVTEYLIDFNATQAAIRAGYSEKTAYSIGQRLLKNVEIKNAINKVREEIQNENILTVKDIEEFLSLSIKGEIEEEVLLTVGTGNGASKIVKEMKQISARDRIKAAELLGKRYGSWTERQDISLDIPVLFEGEDELED